MSITYERLEKYSAMEYLMPLDAQGVGVVSDKEHTVILGFKTQREIIMDIGYYCSDVGNTALHACMNALCKHMEGKATISANTPKIGVLSEMLCDASGFSDEEKKFAMMAELSLKYAVRNYAMTSVKAPTDSN